jgi:hypothetical protein
MSHHSIENIVKDYTNRDLSGTEIEKITGGKSPILYSDLKNYTFTSFFPAIGSYNILLLQTKAVNFGHYVCCWLMPDCIMYFDSYGLGAPDTYKNYTPYDEELPNYLSMILASDPKKRPVVSNKIDYQKWGKAACCGRWSALRTNFRGLTNPQFEEIFRGNHGFLNRPDYVATILTLWALNDVPQYFGNNPIE